MLHCYICQKKLKFLLLCFGLRPDHGPQLVYEFCQIDLRDIQRGFPTLNLAHIQHIIDQTQKVLARRRNLSRIFYYPLRVAGIVIQQYGKPHDCIHWRPDIVTDII